ncbi:MAG: S1 family peptidase [Sciscionella sp.]
MHASEQDFAPLGTAVVIDERRVLTCAHVVMASGAVRSQVWVAFPMAEDPVVHRRRAGRVTPAGHAMADLVVVEFDDPIPSGVAPARLRCPKPGDLVNRGWWAFGFAGHDPRGNDADGVVGASLGWGWVRLDAESRYHVGPGFSGGGLWCPDYDAVVGVVGEANDRGDGRAITLHQADGYLPAEKIHLLTGWTVAAAGELAQAAWGGTLTGNREADRCPRARGVPVATERGYRFQGRTAALTEIVAWVRQPVSDRRVLVVTGSPGVGSPLSWAGW